VQSELFLVINRLDKFAGAVTKKLDTIDLETKRRIVLGLVKRVEIHKDEIVVVFRIDPQLGTLASENLNDSDDGVKSMQHCTRRNFTTAGEYLHAPVCAAWKKLRLERSLGSRIVIYADDLVILCKRGKAEEALSRMREIMSRLKLTVN
jgi:hypothetical protein